jgi:hypothetical protein
MHLNPGASEVMGVGSVKVEDVLFKKMIWET